MIRLPPRKPVKGEITGVDVQPSQSYSPIKGMNVANLWARAGLVGAWVIASALSAQAEEQTPGVGLSELELRAVKQFPEVAAAEAGVRRLEAELSEVRWRPLSGIRVGGVLAPTPERRGDALHSAQGDISFSGDMGILVRADLRASFPIYTFGRHTAQRRAAAAKAEAGRQGLRRAKVQTRLRVQQAYYAYLLGNHTQALLEEGQRFVDRGRRHIEEQLEDDEGDVTESDRLRVEVLASEVDARISEARRAQRLALSALRLLCGLDSETEVGIEPLDPWEGELRPLSFYIDAAISSRAEIQAARATERAASAELRAARAQYLPEVQIRGDVSYAYSNVVDDQQNPFANDPFNHLRYGVGLVVRWDLDVLGDRAKVRQAQARLDQTRARQRQAEIDVALDVEEAYVAAEESQQLVTARRRARRASRGWMVAVLQGIDLGMLEPQELVDALKAYFEQSFRYLEATSRLNRSVSSLQVLSGLGPPAEGTDDE